MPSSRTRRGARLLRLLEAEGWVCHLCGVAIPVEPKNRQLEATVDHVVPRCEARGLERNVMPAHYVCNQRRANMPVADFPRRELANLVSLLLVADRLER